MLILHAEFGPLVLHVAFGFPLARPIVIRRRPDDDEEEPDLTSDHVLSRPRRFPVGFVGPDDEEAPE